MSTQTLSSVATHAVGQYGQVGKLIVGVYRTGAQRVVVGANARYAELVNSRALPLVNEAIKTRLIKMQQQIAGFVEGGIVSGTGRAEQAIDLLAGGVSGGIQRVAATAERVETAFNTTALSTVGALSLPIAQISLEIANRAVDGTKRLSARVVGDRPELAKAKVAAKRVVKKAAKSARAAKPVNAAARRVKARA